jgi:hypothetical protein
MCLAKDMKTFPTYFLGNITPVFITSPSHNDVHQAPLNKCTKNIKIKAWGYGLVGCDDVWFGRWVEEYVNLIFRVQGQSGYLQNFCIYLPNYAASYPTKLNFHHN